MHVNSAVGLLPPGAHLDSGQEVKPSASQRWLWAQWLRFWQDVAQTKRAYSAEAVAVINGDWGDKLRTRNGAQLIEHENESVMVKLMVDAVSPLKAVASAVFVVRGTAAHTGGSGYLEECAAGQIGAQQDAATGLSSFWVLRLQIEDVRLLIAHHPMTNGRVKWTLGSAANRAAASVALDYCKIPQSPDLAIFGHVHHSEDSYDNQPLRVIYTPPWCLANSYTHRLGAGIAPTEQIGGLIIVIDGNRYRVYKRYVRTPVEECKWLRI